MRVVGPAETPAIPVALGKGETLPSEELRLRHRYLDLRRPELQTNIVLRHRLMQATRALSERARLSRDRDADPHQADARRARATISCRAGCIAGEFYALPQSPQLYKQLLMISGLRPLLPDRALLPRRGPARGPAARVHADRHRGVVHLARRTSSRLPRGCSRRCGRRRASTIPTPFPRMTYADAMERYGTDRPDLRYGLELFDATRGLSRRRLRHHARARSTAGGRVRGIAHSGRRRAVAQAGGRARGAREERGRGGTAAAQAREGRARRARRRSSSRRERGAAARASREGELVPARGRRRITCRQPGARPRAAGGRRSVMQLVPARRARVSLGDRLPAVRAATRRRGALGAVHHPFTSPHPDDLALLDTRAARRRARSRTTSCSTAPSSAAAASASAIPTCSGACSACSASTTRRRSSASASCSRGCAPARRRTAASRSASTASRCCSPGATSLRDVIAFPKTTAARALFEGAPTPVPADDLDAICTFDWRRRDGTR